MRTYKNVIFPVLLLYIFSSMGFFISSDDNENKKYENFSLHDYNNKLYSLEDFSDKKGIVIMFVSTQCPVSNAYNERMEKLYQDLKSDFSFIGINSNKAEDMENIKEHAENNNLNFVILKDSNNVVADIFEASFTPEVYVLSNDYKELYHGRIDDSRKEEDVETIDLRNALTEIASGDDVTVKKTKAFGCTIKRIN